MCRLPVTGFREAWVLGSKIGTPLTATPIGPASVSDTRVDLCG